MSDTLDHERELALTAPQRHERFHREIKAKAAALRVPKPFPTWQSVTPLPLPEAELPSMPAPEFYKECWFQIDGVSPCKKLSMMQIKQAVGIHYRVSVEDMVSQRRQKYIVLPRFVAMYLCKQLTPFSLPVIGRDFGGRDHTTALSAIRRVEAMVETDPKLATTVAQLRAHLESLL